MNKKKFSIDEIAEKEVSILSNEDKDYLLNHPDYLDHHFGYGMYLRNEFIHSGVLDEGDDDRIPILFIADDMSEILFNKIIDKLKEEIDK